MKDLIKKVLYSRELAALFMACLSILTEFGEVFLRNHGLVGAMLIFSIIPVFGFIFCKFKNIPLSAFWASLAYLTIPISLYLIRETAFSPLLIKASFVALILIYGKLFIKPHYIKKVA